MSLYPTSKHKPGPPGKTEFELLKSSHKFLRDDDEDDHNLTWEEKLASKYYSSLYREFAVCDLKHYKSGNFALRWRTESEVLSGAGESTCGNTRCKYHESRESESSSLSQSFRNPDWLSEDEREDSSGKSRSKKFKRPLTTVELPFAYVEHGETKSALVKVVLCEKCLGKLMWKRRKQKEELELQSAEMIRQEEQQEEEEEEREVIQEQTIPIKQEDEDTGTFIQQSREETQRSEGVSNSNHRRRERQERYRSDRASHWDRERDIDVGTAGDASSSRRRRKSRSRSPHFRARDKDRDRHRRRS
ncbi:hypothetical protein K435DRAFT_837487 [Dendrothele bispora CBS 962.96]|uniref:Protein FRA10AC1 n=1 Tax=Dendrothele bispora (strain CBS 962.96) TaxID=1314807 RepID=A0A4S8MCX6_DENBC|nr:hypothetical protein K435DRAFT_837487 [Dendrothele bispora CBS 962.96]